MAQILSDKAFLALRKEATWGAHDAAGSDLPQSIYDGSYGVGLKIPTRVQPHIVGDIDRSFQVQDVRDLSGGLEMGLYPDTAKEILDWITVRDSEGNGEFYTGDLAFPGVAAIRHLGLMVNSATINFTDGDDFRISTDLIGQYEENLTPIPTVSGMPEIPSYIFANCRFLLAVDGAGTLFKPVGLESGSITYNNNLQPGSHVEDRVTEEKDAMIDGLYSGTPSVSGSLVVKFDRITYLTMMRTKLSGILKLMLSHRSGVGTTVVGVVTAGSTKTITLTDDTGFAVGDVVRFDTVIDANMSCATVTSLGTSPAGAHEIVVDTLDADLADGDYCYNKAVEIKIPEFKVPELPIALPKGEFVKVTINFTALAEAAADEIFSYKAKA